MKKVIMVLALTGLVVPATFASQGQGQQTQTEHTKAQQTQTMKKKTKKWHRTEKKPEVKKPQ